MVSFPGFISLTWLEVRGTTSASHTRGAFYFEYLAKPTGQPGPRSRAVVLFPQSLESSFLGLCRSRLRLTRAFDLPGWPETKRKWNDIVRLKQSVQPDRSFLFRFDPNFDNFSAEKGNFFKWNGKFRSDDRTEETKRTTFGGGPRWSENFPRTEAFHPILNRNFRNFGIMESTPDAVFHPTSRVARFRFNGTLH